MAVEAKVPIKFEEGVRKGSKFQRTIFQRIKLFQRETPKANEGKTRPNTKERF